MEKPVTVAVGNEAPHHLEGPRLVGNVGFKSGFGKEREKMPAAVGQTEENQGFALQVAKVEHRRRSQPVVRRQGGVERDRDHGLEGNVLLQVEIVGERHLVAAVAQAMLQCPQVVLVGPDADQGLFRRQDAQEARQHDGSKGHETADIKIAGKAPCKTAGLLGEFICLKEKGLGGCVQAPAGRRQGETPRVLSDKELNAEHVLEMRNRSGHGGLGNSATLGATRNAPGFGGGGEVAQLFQRVAYQFILCNVSIENVLLEAAILSTSALASAREGHVRC